MARDDFTWLSYTFGLLSSLAVKLFIVVSNYTNSLFYMCELENYAIDKHFHTCRQQRAQLLLALRRISLLQMHQMIVRSAITIKAILKEARYVTIYITTLEFPCL